MKIQINNFNELATLIESDKLTNNQVYQIVQHSMQLYLSFDEEKLNRKELVKMLKEHHDKWKYHKIKPLFLNLNLSVK